jgi:large subunit ribosomal protein L15
MKLHQLTNKNRKSSVRVGRGEGSGHGKTSGRGSKGQRARSGFNIPRRFEGGQSSIIQRSPKRGGFKSRNIKPIIVNINVIEKNYKENEIVSPESLLRKNVIKELTGKVKILGNGKLTKKLKFENCLMSKTVKAVADK